MAIAFVAFASCCSNRTQDKSPRPRLSVEPTSVKAGGIATVTISFRDGTYLWDGTIELQAEQGGRWVTTRAAAAAVDQPETEAVMMRPDESAFVAAVGRSTPGTQRVRFPTDIPTGHYRLRKHLNSVPADERVDIVAEVVVS